MTCPRIASILGFLPVCLTLAAPVQTFAGILPAPNSVAVDARLSGHLHPASDSKAADQELEVWNAIKATDNAILLEAFLISYPDSIYSALARARLSTLQDSTATATVSTVTQGSATGDYPFDGKWTLTATHLHSPYGRIPFCRSRETMNTTFTVNYGEIDHQTQTNKGAPVNVEGEFSQSGNLLLDVIPWGPNESGGWGGNVKRGHLRIEENMRGKQRVRTIAGEDCKVELVLTRN